MRALRLFLALLLSATLTLTACNKSNSTSSSGNAGAGTTTSAGATDTSAAAAGANCPTSNTTAFAKTKFVAHVGLAVGAFHHFIYKPFKAGSFTSGGIAHKILVYGKAALAAGFTYHEIKKSIEDVKASPILCKLLIAPLSKLADGFSSLKDKLTHRDSSSVENVNSDVSSLTGLAGQNGAAISDIIPSATQLTSG
jgi:hypothetical protein